MIFAVNEGIEAADLAKKQGKVRFMDASVSKQRLKRLWNLKWHKEYNPGDPVPTWPQWMAALPQ